MSHYRTVQLKCTVRLWTGIFGGGDETALHYFGEWKWLVAAAQDLNDGGTFTKPYLYGDLAGDKGVNGLTDDVMRAN